MKKLLITAAVVEAGAGLGLVFAPSNLARLLLGAPLEAPAASAVARIAGAALLALAIACWSARADIAAPAARGIVAAMLLYNCGAVAALIQGAAVGLQGIGLWPTAALHAALAIWCLVCLIKLHSATPEP